jgi:polyisoprenoid-binding protein YceI
MSDESVSGQRAGGATLAGWGLKIGFAAGALGVLLWGLRWILQGSRDGVVVYSDIARAFWVADPTLGWVETQQRWVWLGLDGLGLVVGLLVGAVTMHVLARRHAAAAASGRPGLGQRAWLGKTLRGLALAGAAALIVAPVLPVWAFVSGFPPEGAERLLPSKAAPVASTEVGAKVEALAAPAGEWTVVEVPANLLVARITAGGETFDGKFTGVTGSVQLDPAELARSSATFEVKSASVDTGVELRNKHAREYLDAEKFATIRLVVPALTKVDGAGARRDLSATGRVEMMGRVIDVALTGAIAVLDAAQRKELGVSAPEALLVTASFQLPIAKTALDRSDFDGDALTLNGRFVLAKKTQAGP